LAPGHRFIPVTGQEAVCTEVWKAVDPGATTVAYAGAIYCGIEGAKELLAMRGFVFKKR
jgi:hypothetical protein